MKNIKKVLILGSGPSSIGNETELDAGAFQIMVALKKNGIQTLIMDNNPFSLSMVEVQPANTFVKEINFKNVLAVLKKEQPDAIIPITGGLRAIHITQELLNQGILKELNVEILGISNEALKTVNDSNRMKMIINQSNEPFIPSKLVNNESEAFDVIRDIGFPVIVKPVNNNYSSKRQVCKNADEMSDFIDSNPSDTKYIIEKSVVGFKQIEMVGIRDSNGTEILINGLENIDAVGVHSSDSIVISPIQTLTDIDYQKLRTATFKIMENLDLVGVCHLQFALSNTDSNYFITKINPLINQSTALTARCAGYPLVYACANLMLGKLLNEIQLPKEYNHLTPMLEPTLDHIMVKIPVWPFENIPEASQRLNTVMKSVGSTIGIGRTVEEALLKALRSSQFSPRDVLPNMNNLDNDELINRLIHPQSNRLLVLIEAIRRGYQVEELEELSKINKFYFYKLKNLLDIEKLIVDEPMKLTTIETAHQYGFGDGMMAETWSVPIQTVRAIYHRVNQYPTYKTIESSAGELEQNIESFYSSFEKENESHQESDQTALVIGRGGNKLGPNTAADYYTAELLIQLHKLGYNTIVINNNPNALSLCPQISDKQYIEPIQLGAILNVIELEKPVRIFIPGNRHFLMRQLKKYDNLNVQVLPPDQDTGVILPKNVSYALNFFVTKEKSYFIVSEKLISNFNHDLDYVTNYEAPYLDIDKKQLNSDINISIEHIQKSNWIGLVQILFNQKSDGTSEYVGIRPLRLTETIFLSKATGINWIRELVKFYTHNFNDKIMNHINSSRQRTTVMRANFPFKQLNVNKEHGDSSQEVGAKITFRLKDN
ncbi:ATP-grasp domain-containing protein [Apilactobacillus apisilvae]|uniref:carbamoyl-phosphate synthase (ammonia) n=1 Tax=Apilactobacillus apisilvae TaxID=2923364 RepID=A0ABY4PID2_9LACO|nr:ATP-grasp domain-containing protein [Apilactobacillus apisilvae]UQS85373.1 ATP-grasp domain-containing protein [Apilactobacillus apisilvae]